MVKRVFYIMSTLFIISGLSYGLLRWWKAPLYSSFRRGEALAAKLGCFACHGPGGTQGILNPGSEDVEVPSWDGGTLMMYANNEEEIREWILDGAPKRLHQHSDQKHGYDHALIHMPAYRDKISDRELEELVAYFKAVSWADAISDPLIRKGRTVASEKGCFGCHGPEGKSPMNNPGSLKGYIPPWNSKDFDELVKDDQELEEWILDGITQRFQKNPLARFFLERQKIAMPAYQEHLSSEELKALKAYIWHVKKTDNIIISNIF